MPEVKVSYLSYSYGARKALDNVCFEVQKNSFCGLLGANGAGKSTLFSLLTRLLVTREGSIEIAGCDMGRDHRRALSRMGVVFQQPTLELEMSVDQNMRYFAALHGLYGAAITKRISESLELLQMQERRFDRVRDLNGGHRRRMEIARVLLHKPRVLLLDEPTVGLDAATRNKITDYVHQLTQQGLTVLWATHLVDEIRDQDDVLILHKGQILEAGQAASIAGGVSLLKRFLHLTGNDQEVNG